METIIFRRVWINYEEFELRMSARRGFDPEEFPFAWQRLLDNPEILKAEFYGVTHIKWVAWSDGESMFLEALETMGSSSD